MNEYTKKRVLIICGTLALGLTMAAGAHAQDGQRRGPAMDKIAAELGVSEASLQACMPRPTPGERPDPATIASCLQAQNASLTAQDVADTLAAFKPDQPPRRN